MKARRPYKYGNMTEEEWKAKKARVQKELNKKEVGEK